MGEPVDCAALYEAMRQSEMNQWIGGGDPEFVGEILASMLQRHVPIEDGARVLDFGVGIGRVAVALLRQRPNLKLSGFDIAPPLIEFCRTNIAAKFPNSSFELVADSNDHYERYKDGATAKSRADIAAAYGGAFDAAYAFSVFTHVDVNDFEGLLRFVASLLKPGGRFYFTAFALTAFSRAQIEAGRTKTTLPAQTIKFEHSNEVLIGNPSDRLAFIAYDLKRIDAMIARAGLIPSVIEFGDWRGDKLSGVFQDVFVCRRPLED